MSMRRFCSPSVTSALMATLAVAFVAVAGQAQTIAGTVRDAQTGGPLRSMIVAVYASTGALQSNTTTDANGHYDVPVQPGRYRVLSYDPNGTYATQFSNDAPSFEESPESVVAAFQSVTVNFSLVRAGTVSGFVLTSGGLRPGLTVAAYNLSGTRRGFTSTNAAGNYSLVLPPGAYKTVAYDDAGSLAPSFFRDRSSFEEADVVTVDAGRANTGIDMFLEIGARASGLVTDAAGAPLTNASVIVFSPSGSYVTFASTGADGRFSMTLAPGTYRFVAVDNSFTNAAAFFDGAASFDASPAITLAGGQFKNDLSFRLERGGLVEGRVLNQDNGSGIRNITVAAYNIDGSLRTSVTSDTNGGFALLLPPGNFRIAAFDPTLAYATQFYAQQKSFTRALAVSVSAGQTATLQPFTLLRGGHITGVVSDQATGAPISGAVVAAYDWDESLIGTATTSATGEFRLVVPAGSYRVLAFDPQLRYATGYAGGAVSLDRSNPISVVAGLDVTTNLTLQRGTTVTGTVVDDAQRPVGNLEVSALDLNQNRVASAPTNANGTFQISLVPGTYKLVAVDPAGRYRTSFYGGATFSEAAAVTVTAAGAPQVSFVVQLPSRRRGVHR
jgi:Carboxypeptidase regulatory-like domain